MTGSIHRTKALRPMRSLLHNLPRLPVSRKNEIDFAAAQPGLLVDIAEDAEILMQAMHQGSGAIGQLLAHSAVMVADGTISEACLEALGFLLSEMGDMGAGLMTLAASCRYETGDYVQPAAGK